LLNDPKKQDRDKALIGILTRLANEMQDQDNMLTEVIESQKNLVKAQKLTEQYMRRKQIEVDEDHKKMMNSFSRYRSDMLKLVNEQDTINRNISDLQNVVKATTYTIDSTSHMLTVLDDRLSRHEKTAEEQAEDATKQQENLKIAIDERLLHLEKTTGEQAEHTIKQQEELKSAINEVALDFTRLHADTEKRAAEIHSDTSEQINKIRRDFTKLYADTEKRTGELHYETAEQLSKLQRDFIKFHADTEKRTDELHRETAEQLNKFQFETTRRLLLLDSIVTSLQTLLVRTDPDLKKRPLIVRIFSRIAGFFRFKLPFLFQKVKYKLARTEHKK